MSGTDGRTTVEDLEAMLPQSDPQQDEEEQRLLKSTETAIARTEQKITENQEHPSNRGGIHDQRHQPTHPDRDHPMV